MSDFVPRLNANGIKYAKYWYDANPFYQSGYGMPNCTAYAWGRFWECGGSNNDYRPRLSTGNANDWYSYNDGYSRGTTPQLGAVACWDGYGFGHVAIVEEIGVNYIVISESAWDSFFWRLTTLPLNADYGVGWTFQGYIYNPYSGGQITPGGGGALDTPFLFKRRLERKKGIII